MPVAWGRYRSLVLRECGQTTLWHEVVVQEGDFVGP